MDQRAQDRKMEQVYRLASVIGHKRAIREAAGIRYCEAANAFVPDVAAQNELLARYNREMSRVAQEAA